MECLAAATQSSGSVAVLHRSSAGSKRGQSGAANRIGRSLGMGSYSSGGTPFLERVRTTYL